MNFKVLVAEDNDMNQAVIRGFLNKLQIDCTLVNNGRKAFEAATSETFDLVLMDCQMPVMEGNEATRIIREYEKQKGGLGPGGNRLPIVALTAHALVGDREKCIAAGMDDYLTKPINSKDLFAIFLKRFLTAKKPQLSKTTPV